MFISFPVTNRIYLVFGHYCLNLKIRIGFIGMHLSLWLCVCVERIINFDSKVNMSAMNWIEIESNKLKRKEEKRPKTKQRKEKKIICFNNLRSKSLRLDPTTTTFIITTTMTAVLKNWTTKNEKSHNIRRKKPRRLSIARARKKARRTREMIY